MRSAVISQRIKPLLASKTFATATNYMLKPIEAKNQ
jgi:hypothetical protein